MPKRPIPKIDQTMTILGQKQSTDKPDLDSVCLSSKPQVESSSQMCRVDTPTSSRTQAESSKSLAESNLLSSSLESLPLNSSLESQPENKVDSKEKGLKTCTGTQIDSGVEENPIERKEGVNTAGRVESSRAIFSPEEQSMGITGEQVNPLSSTLPANTQDEMRLSLNPFDLNRLDKLFVQPLLKGNVDARRTVWIDKNDTKETGLILLCSFLKAAVICDLIRSEDRRLDQHPTRVYLYKQKEDGTWSWRKIPFNALLTILRDEVVILNPDVFTPVITRQTVNSNAPKAKKLDL